MNGDERRAKIVKILKSAVGPISGTDLAKELGVSRQIVVGDIALIRANGTDIFSTNRGYYLNKSKNQPVSKVLKCYHTVEQAEDEMNTIVDLGGKIDDVFVYHKVYGVIKADMNIKSRYDVKQYLDAIKSGKSKLLMSITSGYHYHTISAESVEILERIKEAMSEKGYLAPLTDYEPVDF
ncbi:MAG: transcription repressor NadR [Eubacterium sp.]|nr:transcription repressor NadR [Eubacterium sp.]